MKCSKHGKEVMSICTWCGKQICQKCIKLTDGKKHYCESCSDSDIGKRVRERQLNQMSNVNDF